MADLKITVDVASLVDAKKKLAAFQKQMGDQNSVLGLARGLSTVERNISELIKAQQKNQLSGNAFKKGLLEQRKALEAMGMSSYMARKRVEELENALRNDAAAKKAARAAEELARAQQQATQRALQLKRQFVQGYAASEIAEQRIRDLNEAYRQGIVNAGQYDRALAQIREEQRRNADAAQRSTRGINSMGVMFQQTGYQVGDFLVQIQSGTNAFVAFGQQATQIAGTLTLLGGKWLAIGSALGIAIPLLTAVAAGIMRTRNAAQEASQALANMTSAYSELESSLNALESAQENYTTAVSLLGDVQEDTTRRVLNALQQEYRARENIARLQRQELLLRREELRQEIEERQRLIQSLTAEATDQTDMFPGSFIDVGAAARRELLQEIIEANREIFLQQARSNAELDLMNSLLDQMSSNAEEVISDFEELRQQAEDSKNAAAAFGEKLAEAAEEARQAAAEARDLKSEMAEAKQEAERLAAIDIASGLSGGVEQAKEIARFLGISVSYAAILGRMGPQGVPSGGQPDGLVGGGRGEGPQGPLAGSVDAAILRLGGFVAPPSLDRSGGGATREQEDYLLNLQREADLRLQMIGLSEEEQRRLELVHELTTRNLPVEDERIQALIATETALREAMQAEQQREQLLETVQSSLEAGFMAMIDGSKSVEDAFRSMIRAILMEIVKQQIVSPIASGITSFLFPGRASGGSMTAGNPYIVGENGPELVIPSRGSTVANADLTNKAMGGGEPVVINQTFQFSANGDDSVKRIIAAEAPKIAALTQKQIVDQRRRGGQMRNAFG